MWIEFLFFKVNSSVDENSEKKKVLYDEGKKMNKCNSSVERSQVADRVSESNVKKKIIIQMKNASEISEDFAVKMNSEKKYISRVLHEEGKIKKIDK